MTNDFERREIVSARAWRIWAIFVLTALLTSAWLLFVASMRYAVALVYPPLPVPDYGVQASIAYIGMGAVLVTCASFTVSANRRATRWKQTVTWGIVIALILTVMATALAPILSAR